MDPEVLTASTDTKKSIEESSFSYFFLQHFYIHNKKISSF